MSEKEYIERGALKQKKVYSLERHEYVVPVAEIDWMPAADVVAVVRCKDCKHWGGVTFGYICREWSGMTFRNYTKPNHYCSRGERKEQT